MTLFTTCINNELPYIYGNSTEILILNIYNQDFILEKSIDVEIGDFIVTLKDVMDNNNAFVVTTTINNIESRFLKIFTICCNNEEINSTC